MHIIDRLTQLALRVHSSTKLPYLASQGLVRQGIRAVARTQGLELQPNFFIRHALQMVRDGYEPEMIAFFRERVKPGFTVIDVGANIGYVSRELAKCVTHSGEVLAFEPNPQLLPICAANVRAYPWVRLFPLALSDASARLGLFVTEDSMATGSLHEEAVRVRRFDAAQSVRRLDIVAVRGDELLQTLGVKRVDLIKVDVEGHELSVLQGLEATLRSSRPLLVFEVCKTTQASKETQAALYSWVSGLAYDVHRWADGKLEALDAHEFLRWVESIEYDTAYAVPRQEPS